MVDRFKQAIRITHRQIRGKLSHRFQTHASHKISTCIQQLDQYRQAKHLAFYHPISGEVSLHQLWHTAPLHGKYCYFPRLTIDGALCFVPATPATRFIPNRYQILEPDVSLEHAIPPSALDIIFLPMVAFDTTGNRLGMGAGYYDKTLNNNSPGFLIGVAYEFQLVSYIHADHYDVPVNLVVTERHCHWSKR